MIYQDNHVPTSSQDYLFQELGIDRNSGNPTFQPHNQPATISLEESGHTKYAAKGKYESDDQDEVPDQRQYKKVGKVEEDGMEGAFGGNPIPTLANNNRKTKKVVRANRRVGRNNKKGNKKQHQEELTADIGMNQVAEWAEQGTKVDHNAEHDSFQQEDNQRQVTNEQLQIKRRIQQKLKKYQNPGSISKPQGNTLNSLKNKAQSLKRQKDKITNTMDTSHQPLTTNMKYNQKIEQEEQEQDDSPKKNKLAQPHKASIQKRQQQAESQESDDPWEKINQNTLAKKDNDNKKMKAHEEDPSAVLKYYQKYQIVNSEEDDDEEQPETGFFQQLCGCLNPKKKTKNQVQRRLIQISKTKLSNTVQEMALLKEIWINLTNKRFLRYGEHWNQIGFQNRDPATDLRGGGVLSLVQWYAFILENKELQIKFYNFCIEFDIPLALTHIKITSLLISSIKKGVIGGKQWKDYQLWYNSFTYYTFNYIQNNRKNTAQIGEFVQQAIERTKKNIQASKNQYLNFKRK